MRTVHSDAGQLPVELTAGAGNAPLIPAHASQSSTKVKREPKRVVHALGASDVYEGPSGRAESKESGTRAPAGTRPILLYNDECAVCRRISSWVMASDDPSFGGGQLIDERPIGNDPDALKALHPGLDIWDAYAEIHLIMPDGTIKKGGEAIAEVLRRLPETRWFAWTFDVNILGFRPFQMILDAAYTVLDKVRPALGCESCGTGVPWWGKPIEWGVKLWRAISGSKSEESHASPAAAEPTPELAEPPSVD